MFLANWPNGWVIKNMGPEARALPSVNTRQVHTPAGVYSGRGQAILKQRMRIKRKIMETQGLQYRKYAA